MKIVGRIAEAIVVICVYVFLIDKINNEIELLKVIVVLIFIVVIRLVRK